MKGLMLILFFTAVGVGDTSAQFMAFHNANNGTNTIVVPEGETWHLLCYSLNQRIPVHTSATLSSDSLASYIEGVFPNPSWVIASPFALHSLTGTPLPGPLFLAMTNHTNGYYLALKKVRTSGGPAAGSAAGSAAVAIPSSATGDVDIKLEQSADQVVWTECQPGLFNSSTAKRFFRLRAVER